MVLAAGAGTRLRPLTYELPKPVIPVLNRPVIHYVLTNLSRHGIKDIMVNTHHHPDQIRSFCGDGSRWGVRISYSHESTLLGTAGAVKKVEEFFKDGPFFVLAGDGYSDIDLSAMLDFHRKSGGMATLAVKDVDARFEYGVTLMGRGGRVRGFLEKPLWGDIFSKFVNTSIYLVEPEVLRYMPKGRPYDFGHEVWPKLLGLHKPLYAYKTHAYWCDVGSVSEFKRCQTDSLMGMVHFPLPGREIRRGVRAEEDCRISPTAKFEPPCLIGKNVVVGNGARVGPNTVIGRGSRVGAGATLKNCILFDNVTIGSHAYLSNCIIGQGGSARSHIAIYGAAILNVRE